MNAPEPSIQRLQQLLAKTTDAALAVSSVEGPDVFAGLARRLADILRVGAAMIAVHLSGDLKRMRTRAAVLDGRTLAEFEYDVDHSPCRGMVGRSSRFVDRGVNAEFAPGTIFQALGFDSYAGHTLVDSRGRTLGLIVVIDRAPMTDTAVTEAVLQVFAVRAAAELEREQAERALRESEASYRAIFEASEDAIFVHDWDTGAILDVSPKAAELYGHPREALQHLRVGDISANVPPYTEAHAVAQIERAKESAEPTRFEWHARHRDGHLMWNEVTLKRAQIAGKRRVLAFVRDITDRKQASEALQVREEQYRTIFDGTADGLVLWDEALRVVDVNSQFLQMYGFAREDLLDNTYPAHLPADYVQERKQFIRRGLAGERVEARSIAIRKDGSTFDIEVRLLPIRLRDRPHALAIVRDISERQRAEEQLRASEERYRLLFETESDAILLVDVETLRLVDANRAATDMYGHTRAELLAMTALDLSTDPQATRASIQQGQGALSIPLRIHRRKDGTEFPVEIKANRLVLDGRRTVVAAVRDVTERKRAEQALRDSEEQYRAIFNASADAMVLWDSDLRRVDINPAYERLFGLTREQVLAGIGFEHLPVDYTEQRRQLVRRSLAGEPCQVELESLRRDGERLLVEVRTIPIQKRGAPHVLAIVRDITERRRAEDALRASEAQYRAIFNASADALVLRDADFRIVDVNATYEAMSGYSRDEVLGVDRVIANPPEVHDAIRALHERALAGEPIVFETVLQRRDGARYELELRGVPIQHRGAPHVLYMGRDMTARRQAERKRRELEAQLLQAQKMEAIGQLTGGIAHDFNNILASIMGYGALALERPGVEADPQLVGHLEQMQQACRRARDLILQMLTFSRGQRGEKRPVQLATLVDESTRLLRATLPSATDISLAPIDAAAVIEGDPVQVQQVLLNLCINARDAVGGHGHIVIGIQRRAAANLTCASCRHSFTGAFIELSVADSGPGIAPDLREQIFEPFFSTKAPGRGTGMGLATVHRIVHDHGGHLLLDTDPALGGARVTVLLPVAADTDARAAPAPTHAAATRRPPLSGRVLLVDDEASVLSFMRELLGNWGLDVVATLEPHAALARLRESPTAFDLVLTDQTMPQMSGLDLASAAAALDLQVPVLLYSGYADLIDAEAARRAGVCRLLRKPVEPAELRAALESCIAERNARHGA